MSNSEFRILPSLLIYLHTSSIPSPSFAEQQYAAGFVESASKVIDKVCTEGVGTFRHELSVAGAIPALVHVFGGEYQLAPTIEDAHPETVYELSVNDKLVVKPVTIGGEGAGIGKSRVAGYHHCIGNGLAEPAFNSCG